MSIRLPETSNEDVEALRQKMIEFLDSVEKDRKKHPSLVVLRQYEHDPKINKFLRWNHPGFPPPNAEQNQKSVKLLDKLLCDEGVPTMPNSLTVYRGLTQEDRFTIDDFLTDRAQKSTSLRPFVGLRFCKLAQPCVILQIEIPPGSPIFMMQPRGDFLNEQEILLPRNTRFVQTGDFRVVTLRDRTVTVVPVRAELECSVPKRKRSETTSSEPNPKKRK